MYIEQENNLRETRQDLNVSLRIHCKEEVKENLSSSATFFRESLNTFSQHHISLLLVSCFPGPLSLQIVIQVLSLTER
jgi:hypothetical protein